MTKKPWPYYAVNKDHQILISKDEGKTWQPLDETELNIDCTPLPKWTALIEEMKKEGKETDMRRMMLSDYLDTPDDCPEGRIFIVIGIIMVLLIGGGIIWGIIELIKVMPK